MKTFTTPLEVKNEIVKTLGAQVCAQLIHNIDSQNWLGWSWQSVLRRIVGGKMAAEDIITDTFAWVSSFEGSDYWDVQNAKWRHHCMFN